MKLVAFAIRDQKVGEFAAPMWFRSRGEAIRAFADEVNRPESMLCKHAEDYELFELGSVECESGVLSPVATGIQPLGNGSQFKKLGRDGLALEA